ncbi:MAG: hypothetical protein J2O49_08745 [Sciscionella sp.]|nr:hypothetical protein [Sciscionella sp.]
MPGQQYWPPQRPALPLKGPAFAVIALMLGIAGCVVPLLPIDLTGVRAFVAFPPAVLGAVCGIVGLATPRRGKPIAVIGLVLCLVAFVLGTIMLGNMSVH